MTTAHRKETLYQVSERAKKTITQSGQSAPVKFLGITIQVKRSDTKPDLVNKWVAAYLEKKKRLKL